MEEMIKTLKELEYGWIDLNGNKHDKIDKDIFVREYKLQSPSQLVDRKIGICWDMVEYEREYLEKNNIKYKSILLVHEYNNKPLIHTFIIYKEDHKYYWMEYAFKNIKNILEFDNIIDCFESIKKGFIEENHIKEIGEFTFYIYDKPKYGINQNDFIMHCVNGIKIKDIASII